MPETANSPLSNLLIVDDEITLLKILERMFKKHYNVKTAENPMQALELLEKGFKPGVILSDQKMPGMNGSEFLKRSIKYVPFATRIILTGYSNPKDIIAAINEAQAFMYLTKPAEEMELVQAVKVGFDTFKAKVNNSKLIAQLKAQLKNQKATALPSSDVVTNTEAGSPLPIIQMLNGFNTFQKRFYFKNKTNSLIENIKLMAEELDLKPENVKKTVLSALLFPALGFNMPAKFHLVEPQDLLNPKEREEFISYYKASLNSLLKIPGLKPYVQVLAQLWEHNDGSGWPNNLSGKEISKEAQIITIINTYFNSVFRLPYSKYPQFLTSEKLVQSPAETKERHDETIKTFFRNAKWYDLDVFQLFQEFTKKHRFNNLLPDGKDLVLTNFDWTRDVSDYMANMRDAIKEKSRATATGSDNFGSTLGGNSSAPIEKEISVEELKLGMLVNQTLATKEGMVICRPDTRINPALLDKITQLNKSNMLRTDVIMVTIEPES